MGKISGHYKIITILSFLCVLLLQSTFGETFLREDELFEKGYESYLSYQPEMALEYFKVFLDNYPDSSALDAVIFWKAKSLMQSHRTDDALTMLKELKRTMPESPFVPFIEKELSIYK